MHSPYFHAKILIVGMYLTKTTNHSLPLHNALSGWQRFSVKIYPKVLHALKNMTKLEQCVYFYHEFQLEQKNRRIELLLKDITIYEDRKNTSSFNVDHSFGQSFLHKEDAVWVGERLRTVGLCVVDGIGGYRDKGFNSGIMAREFAASMGKKF